MTALLIIVLVTVIGIILLAQLGKDHVETEEEHRERIDSLARQIASHDQEPQVVRVLEEEEEPLDGLSCSFKLRGLYYRDSDAQEEARHLQPGDPLKLLHDAKNRKDKFAIMVCSMSNFLGYVPREISEKVCRNLDQIEKCEVESTFDVDDIPDLYCRIRFKGKTVFYWEDYLDSLKAQKEYKEKYPVLGNLGTYEIDDIQSRLDIWKKLHEEHPEDVFLEYHYIFTLHLNRDYRQVVELGNEFRDRLKLHGWSQLDNMLMAAQERVDRLDEAEIREQYVSIYQKSHDLLTEKQYEEALQGFLRCLDSPYQVQALPKNICKCYEKLHRTEDCVDFAKSAMKRRWLTQATKDALQKYIDKYSAI